VKTYRLAILILILGTITALGCAGLKFVPKEDNTARLISHPDFDRWAQSSPELTRDAMSTITRLEAELQAERGKR
jgi:hypothetical protein